MCLNHLVHCECLTNIVYNVRTKYDKLLTYFWYIENVDNLEKCVCASYLRRSIRRGHGIA